MLKLSVGKGHQVIKQLCLRVLQYYATVATEHTGYALYRALLCFASLLFSGKGKEAVALKFNYRTNHKGFQFI